MTKIYTINEALTNFYNNLNNTNIDLNTKEDRIELSMTILELSNNTLTHYSDLLQCIITDFYNKKKELNKLFTQEFIKALEFLILSILHKTHFTYDDSLRDKVSSILLDIKDEVSKAWNYEINNKFNDALNVWRELLGEEFEVKLD